MNDERKKGRKKAGKNARTREIKKVRQQKKAGKKNISPRFIDNPSAGVFRLLETTVGLCGTTFFFVYKPPHPGNKFPAFYAN